MAGWDWVVNGSRLGLDGRWWWVGVVSYFGLVVGLNSIRVFRLISIQFSCWFVE